MANAPLYSAAGELVGEATLDDALFGQPVRVDLVHQAVLTERSNRRQGTHSSLNRSRVRGGGAKPYRQKGTGRARQGTLSAPHYRHGGAAFGPVPHHHNKRMPQKMRRAAFRSALSAKAADGGIRVLEGLGQSEISTKQFALWLSRLDPGKNVVLVLAQRDDTAYLSARNLQHVRVVVAPGLSTYEVVRNETLILTQDAVTRLQELYAG